MISLETSDAGNILTLTELRENVNKEITSGQNDDEKKIEEENTEINEDAASTVSKVTYIWVLTQF